MSQIPSMISASASLVDAGGVESSPFKLLVILGCVSFFLFMIASAIFSTKNKENLSAVCGTVGFIIGLAFALTGLNLGFDALKESEARSNTNIANFIHEKYDVTVLNDQNIGADISEHTTLTLNPIPAKAPSGERIQITVELSEDGTDVLAFSSGAEMKKVSEK
jgi:hypothetical protein